MDLNAAFKITASVAGQQALDKLNSSVGQLSGLAKSAGLALAGLGAGIGLSVFKDKFDQAVDSAVKLKDAAEKTGSTVENMGKLAQAAKITGDSFEGIEAGVIRLTKSLAGSDDEAKGAAKALGTIGLSIKDLRSQDPAEAFGEIAKALDQFEDGAGKTAIAMDIFGKRGAELLPFLKDYVEIGDMVSKTTAQQAEMADQYQRNLIKLSAAKNELYRAISMAVLPAANDFVKAMLEVNKQAGGVRETVKGLAKDGSITSWADMAVQGMTYVIDAGEIIIRMFRALGTTIAAAAAQVSELFSGVFDAMNRLKSGDLGGAWQAIVAGGQRTMAVGDSWAEQIKELATNPTYGSKLREQLSVLRQMRDVTEEAPKKKSLTGYQSRTPTGTTADPYATELQSLGREAAKLEWQLANVEKFNEKIASAKEAQVRFDLSAKGKLADIGMDSAKGKALIEAAQAVDKFAESLRQALAGLEYDKQTKAIELNTKVLGQNNLFKQEAAALQDLENKGIKEGTELYTQLAERRLEALRKQKQVQQSFEVGVKDGLNSYIDKIEDAATSAREAVTKSFSAMEDALTNFVMTGKLSFSDFANSVIKDMIRIAIQQSITRPLAEGLLSFIPSLFPGPGSIGGGATGLDSLPASVNRSFAGGGYTGSGSRSGGMDGQGGFLAVLHPQETVIDHAKGQGAGGNMVVNVTVNAETGVKQSSDDSSRLGQLGNMIAGVVKQELINQKRPGGLLAAA